MSTDAHKIIGAVVALHVRPSVGKLLPMDRIEAVEQKGIVGDSSFGWTIRQVLFMSTDTLSELGYQPGELREQITVDFPGLHDLPVGTRLAVGSAEFELDGHCAPCHGMAKVLDEDPVEFVAKTDKRRGILARVLTSGTIQIGDEVHVV